MPPVLLAKLRCTLMFANELDYLRCVEPPHIDNPPMSFIMLLKSSHVGHNMSLLEGFAHLVIVMGPTPFFYKCQSSTSSALIFVSTKSSLHFA